MCLERNTGDQRLSFYSFEVMDIRQLDKHFACFIISAVLLISETHITGMLAISITLLNSPRAVVAVTQQRIFCKI